MDWQMHNLDGDRATRLKSAVAAGTTCVQVPIIVLPATPRAEIAPPTPGEQRGLPFQS